MEKKQFGGLLSSIFGGLLGNQNLPTASGSVLGVPAVNTTTQGFDLGNIQTQLQDAFNNSGLNILDLLGLGNNNTGTNSSDIITTTPGGFLGFGQDGGLTREIGIQGPTPVDRAVLTYWGDMPQAAYEILQGRVIGQDTIGGENRPLDTSAVNKNRNGITDTGLFQVNSNTAKDFKKRHPRDMKSVGYTGPESLKDPLVNAGVARLIFNEQGHNAFFGSPESKGNKKRIKKLRKRRKFQRGGRVLSEYLTDKEKRTLRRQLKKGQKEVNEQRQEYIDNHFDSQLESYKELFNQKYSNSGIGEAAITPRSGLQILKKGGKVRRKKKKKYQLGGQSLQGRITDADGGFLDQQDPATFSPLLPSGNQLAQLQQQLQLQSLMAQTAGLTPQPVQQEQSTPRVQDGGLTGSIPVSPLGLLTGNDVVAVPSRELTFNPGGIELNDPTLILPIPGFDAVVELKVADTRVIDKDKKKSKKRRRKRTTNRECGPRTGPSKSWKTFVKETS